MTENEHIQAKYFENSDEELNGVKRTFIEVLRELSGYPLIGSGFVRAGTQPKDRHV